MKPPGFKSSPMMEEKGFVSAIVISNSLDGCSWLIELGDGRKLEPVNLGEEFKKENLSIWIKYTNKKGAVSICMAGDIITITEIELRKDE